MIYKETFQPIPRRQLWFGVGLPPVVWALHLVLVYAIQSVSCHLGFLQFTILGIHALRFVLLVLTVLAAACVFAGGWLAYQNYQKLDQSRGADAGWKEGRIIFMTQGAILLAGIFLFSLVLSIVPILVLEPCALFWW